MTDLPLTCAPHLIAVIAMFLAVVFYPYTRSNAARPPGQDSLMGVDGNSFSSMGGRPGLAGVLGSAMHGLPMNPPTTAASANQSQTNGAGRPGASEPPRLITPDRAQTMAVIQQ